MKYLLIVAIMLGLTGCAGKQWRTSESMLQSKTDEYSNPYVD